MIQARGINDCRLRLKLCHLRVSLLIRHTKVRLRPERTQNDAGRQISAPTRKFVEEFGHERVSMGLRSTQGESLAPLSFRAFTALAAAPPGQKLGSSLKFGYRVWQGSEDVVRQL